MPEFTLRLEPSPIVASLHDQIESSEANVVLTKLHKGLWYYLTVEVRTFQITIYLGMLSLIVMSFAVFYWGMPAWVFLLPGLLIALSIMGSSYYWILVFWLRLRRLGYKGRFKVAHAEGLF